MKITQSINNEGNPLRKLSDIGLIIHHHTGSKGDSQKFLNKTDYVSCHYLIKKHGEIVQLMDHNVIAYHCGVSAYKGYKTKNNSLNWCSIGIEVEGGGSGHNVDDFTDNQRILLRHLTDKLTADYNAKVLRHKDIAPLRKVDPYDCLYPMTFEKEYLNN